MKISTSFSILAAAALFAGGAPQGSAFAPVAVRPTSLCTTSMTTTTTALQAGVMSQVVQLATFAGAIGTIVVAPKSGTGVSSKVTATPAPATSTAAGPSGDVSVPYDSAAMLAYEATDKSMSFEEFKPKYVAETVAMIKSKQKQPVAA